MKKFAFILIAAAFLTWTSACNEEADKQSEEQTTEEQVQTEENATANAALEVEALLKDAASKVDKEISVTGYVTHTCKHSGRRCFIVGENPEEALRIEATEIPEGFKAELVGSKIIAKGILREKRMTKEEIEEKEAHLNEELKEEDGSAEHCHAGIAKMQKMKDWMKANEKDYYPIYFVDGTAYEVTEEKEAE
ncbi:MAG: hypothetical protein CSB06_02085 [Bacteroidia bacterium]|nr:MAG: hypothetical protein CSB06_02085 [Bacteroidia bacterium]